MALHQSFESNDFIIIYSRLFDNPRIIIMSSYDDRDDKRILACKCYLKMASKYYNIRMFSGDFGKKNTNRVVIDAYNYNYDVYYSYLFKCYIMAVSESINPI
uniref:Uncharacterized protein LOC113790854 n=1 Tax=Dermatophagoides pteronyssinus TaxID=6956 RepID=A0A6P6XSK5_DERPT|nr:uncharacterized protein LOC113790854 [Dermatophagoides pteronyssinus]